jgi:hypothetical protein
MEVGDRVEANQDTGRDPNIVNVTSKIAGKVGRIIKVEDRRPTFKGFPNDQVLVKWDDGSDSRWSTYWLQPVGDGEVGLRVGYWIRYFENV